MSAAGDLALAEIEGELSRALDGGRIALSLPTEEADGMAHTSLLSTYSYALGMSCRYEESLRSIAELTRVAEAWGVHFPLPYAQLYTAMAYIGLRRFSASDRALGALERETRNEPGDYFRGHLPIQRARLYASVGDLRRAVEALALGPIESGRRGFRGEFLAWQGLLRAASSEFDLAEELACAAHETSRSLEATSLVSVTRAIAALRSRSPNRADAFLESAIATEAWDPILIAVRAVPDLGRRIAQQREAADWLRRILVMSSDRSLAALIGLPIPRAAMPKQNLTPREEDVHELLAQGLTNEEIAASLYISLSTTKVHVKHIYDKLGVRSRLEAARALRGDV
jgi:DNA-binding NarL/FixJ family response regulator